MALAMWWRARIAVSLLLIVMLAACQNTQDSGVGTKTAIGGLGGAAAGGLLGAALGGGGTGIAAGALLGGLIGGGWAVCLTRTTSVMRMRRLRRR
jgi:hypothetical protein